jgi:fructose-bisphosphate aldolase class 1
MSEMAAECQRGGLVPLVDCVIPIPNRFRLAESERMYVATMGEVMIALDRAGVDANVTVLGLSPVTPGDRSGEADESADVARSTIRSLREAGVGDIAGIVFKPAGRAGNLTAHLAAMQWTSPNWPIGFLLSSSVLASIARIWKGRPDRLAAAQHELQASLTCTSAVLRAGLNEMRRRNGHAWWDV